MNFINLQIIFTVLLLVISQIIRIFYPITDVASEHQIGTLSVYHPLFKDPQYHSHAEYFRKGKHLSQFQRLKSIQLAIQETTRIFDTVGLSAFIESGTLIGHIRHKREGGLIPWDEDADVGIYAPECEKKFPKNVWSLHLLLRRILDREKFLVPFLMCRNRGGDGRNSHAGRIIHKETGFFVDIFSYAPLEDQSKGNWVNSSVTWIERLLDDIRVVVTNTSLFPIQIGKGVNVPARPVDFLNFQYGVDLDIPKNPWRFGVYLKMSNLSLMLNAAVFLLFENSYHFLMKMAYLYFLYCFGGAWRIMFIAALILIGLLFSDKRRHRHFSTEGFVGNLMVKWIVSFVALVSLINDLREFVFPWITERLLI